MGHGRLRVALREGPLCFVIILLLENADQLRVWHVWHEKGSILAHRVGNLCV